MKVLVACEFSGVVSQAFRDKGHYDFGHSASKKTGLWLKNLPLLQPTERVVGRIVDGKERGDNQTDRQRPEQFTTF